jgi:Circularly permutated YpsA SLOG family
MRLISGGQTGADRAALDLALELGIDHGGWVPKGCAAEDGPLPSRYRVRETPSEDRAERTQRNVVDSDATLLISHGPLTGGSELTRTFAAELGKPVLYVELSKLSASEAADRIARWLGSLGCRTLNVAGPRASEEAGIYAAASAVLRHAISEHLGGQQKDGRGAALAHAADR